MRRKLIDRVDHNFLLAVLYYMCHNGAPITKASATRSVHYHVRLCDDVDYFQNWKEDFKEATDNDDQDLERAYQYVAKYWPDKEG